MASRGELTEVLRVRVSPAMLAAIANVAAKQERSPSHVARSAIRSYLTKEGKR